MIAVLLLPTITAGFGSTVARTGPTDHRFAVLGHSKAGGTLSSCGVGGYPSFLGYDSVNHYMYVPNQLGGNVSVVASPCKVVGTVKLPVNADPVAVAFCPQNDYMYVVDTNLNQVYVVSKFTVVSTISGGHFNTPDAIAWDPGDSIMLVANFGWSNLTAVRGTSFYGSLAVGDQPDSIVYDPYYNTLLVENFGSLNITIIPSATYPFTTPYTNTTYAGG
ncbi:MAG: hypothetical protein L3K09_07405, partial [Thermoplasmata archaeon]|nr:hypothetical protein [Thermoplasmata archaeon]